MHVKIRKTTLNITQKAFSSLSADVLIFPANDYLWMGNETASLIKKLAGGCVEKEALAQGPAPMGTVVVTQAGDLPYRYIFHTVCMGQDGIIDTDEIKEYVTQSLKSAETKQCSNIIMLPFYAQHCDAPLYTIAQQMIEGCMEHCIKKCAIESINVSIPDEKIFSVFEDTLAKVFSIKKQN